MTHLLVRKPTVIYDGVCNLCNSGLRFVAKYDHGSNIQFVSVQSKTGRRLIEREGLTTKDAMKRFIFLPEDGSGERSSQASSAAFQVMMRMDPPFHLLGKVAAAIVPTVLGDIIYDMVAQRRYALCGKTESSQVPPKELHARFIDYKEENAEYYDSKHLIFHQVVY